MRLTLLAFGSLVLGLAAGCAGGPKLVPVKGTLTNAGKAPVPNPAKSGITIVFTPIAESVTRTYPATPFDPDTNSFEVQGPDGKGIPEGKYKVTVNVMTVEPSPVVDKINATCGGNKTPIEVDVKGPNPVVNIDLSQYIK